MNIDKLVFERKQAYDKKDYKESDRLRDLLDENNVFCFDMKDGTHEVHYIPKCKPITRRELIEEMKRNRKAEKEFESWAYTHSSKNAFLGK